MSHRTWGSSKIVVSTTWDADWDSCSIANHAIIILNPSPCHNQEVLIITNREIKKLIEKFVGLYKINILEKCSRVEVTNIDGNSPSS